MFRFSFMQYILFEICVRHKMLQYIISWFLYVYFFLAFRFRRFNFRSVPRWTGEWRRKV